MTFAALLILLILLAVFWNKPKHLLFLAILLLPAYQIRFAVLGIPTTILEIAILTTFIRWFFVTEKTHIIALYTEHRALAGLMALFICAATIAMFIAPDTRAAAGIYKAYFIEPILLFIVFIDVIRTPDDIRRVVLSFAAVSATLALATIAQFFALIPTPSLWLAQERFTGLFPYPNANGLFLAPLIPIFLAAAHTVSEKKESMILMAIALISLIAIFLTKTEGAIVALMAAYIVWGFIKNRRTRLLSFLAIAALITIIQTNTFVADKLLFRDWSGTVRALMWINTIDMLEQHRFLGVGLSGYPIVFREFHQHPAIEIFQYPHNIVLNVWSEIGPLGLTAFLGIIGYFYYMLFNQAETKKDIFYHAIGIGMLVLLIHGLVDVPYFKNDLSVLFWIILGFMITSPQLDKSKKMS